MGLIFVVNNNFLERIIYLDKTMEMQEMYQLIDRTMKDGSFKVGKCTKLCHLENDSEEEYFSMW